MFALLIVWAGTADCVDAFDASFDFAQTYSAAWTLSWTTFTTVGYGNIYPSINSTCAGINFVCMFNAFLGVLYASFCGAILFGKVSVIYSRAGVTFSAGCVLRYGDGVDDNDDDHDYEESSVQDISDHALSTEITPVPPSPRGKRFPFPFISFRVVNEYTNYIGGTIMNLSINVAAAVERKDEIKVDSLSGKKQYVPRRRFHNLDVDPSSVSHFDRVLYVRHKLDSKSPLITAETRKAIKKNGNHWPTHLNNPKDLKACIEFAQIYVSLEGVSEDSKSSVYSKMAYEKDDIKIGYKFMDMTYKDHNSKVEYKVDFSRLNMIVPHDGCDDSENSAKRIKLKRN